jgi:class 3 adenylate cyclase
MLDIVGFTTLTNKVGAEASSAEFKHWLEAVRPILVRHGGTINAYLGDAIFVYWRQDRHSATRVAAALSELANLQTTYPLKFRILAHHGRVRISGGQQGESLSGSDVIYLFRIEKATKGFGSLCVLSEPAATSLSLTAVARPLGRTAVPDFEGEHAFFALGS